MIGNSDRLIEQQTKTIENAEKEVESWGEIVSNNSLDIAQDVTDITIDKLGSKARSQYNVVGLGYGFFENGVKVGSMIADAPQADLWTNRVPNAAVSLLNTADMYIGTIPVLSDNLSYKLIHNTLLFGPLAVDVSFRQAAYKPNLQKAKDNLGKAKLDLGMLKSRIESWKNELEELKNCGTNCDLIRRVMARNKEN